MPSKTNLPPLPSAQLFDIETDPGETTDLATAEPDRVARMERELAAWFADVEGDRRAIGRE